jgi:hypothetical protein
MVALKTPIDAHSNITVLREIICWARKFWHVLYIPALSKWDLWARFYDFLPVTLWIKKTTILAFTSFLKDSFLVKRKLFVCMLLLPVYVSRFTSAHIHFRRCGFFVFKATETMENIPIPVSVVSVLIFCILSKRLQRNRWLSTVNLSGVWKNS